MSYEIQGLINNYILLLLMGFKEHENEIRKWEWVPIMRMKLKDDVTFDDCHEATFDDVLEQHWWYVPGNPKKYYSCLTKRKMHNRR